MKFLIDNALSPIVSDALKKLGHDSVHVREINLQKAEDEVIFREAFNTGRTIISADTDFSLILSRWETARPSLILFRKEAERNPVHQIELLKLNLTNEIVQELEIGCVLIIESNRIRIRKLPFAK